LEIAFAWIELKEKKITLIKKEAKRWFDAAATAVMLLLLPVLPKHQWQTIMSMLFLLSP
jgi:hypothetical protein